MVPGDNSNETKQRKPSDWFVCNECLAIYSTHDDFERHTHEMNHRKGAIRLDLLFCHKVDDNKVLALFSLPNDELSPSDIYSHSSPTSRT